MTTRIRVGTRVEDYYGNAGTVTAVEPPPADSQGRGTDVQVQWDGGTARTWLDAGDVTIERDMDKPDPGAPGTALEQRADMMTDKERMQWIADGMP